MEITQQHALWTSPNPLLYYDTFALRDISGAKPVTQSWPFFLATESRNAVKSNSPVPVKSCWNGIVVFQADPFYKSPPLSFRGIPDSLAVHHLEGSECCLIHADNELSTVKGVWLNPNVRYRTTVKPTGLSIPEQIDGPAKESSWWAFGETGGRAGPSFRGAI